MTNQNILSRLIYGIVFILIFSGCAQLNPKTDLLVNRKAFLLASQAKSFNRQIMASKGTGWIKIETATKVDKFRIAWAAAFPNKIRITFLMSGHPLETIIAFGEKITFFSHTGQHPKTSYMSKDPNLENYIQIPVKLSELILVLLGRYPLKKFDTARFLPSDPSMSSITLKQNWTRATQFLHLNDTGKVDHISSKGLSGKLLYKMAILKYNTYNFGDIPVKIELKDMKNRKLTLKITDFLPNPSIKEAVFQLTEPG